MERMGITAGIDFQVSGADKINNLTDSVKMSVEELERFQELGKWENETRKIQAIEAESASYSRLAQQISNANSAKQNNYSLEARRIYDGQNDAVQQLFARYNLTSKQGIEAYQKDFRKEEIARTIERIETLNDSIEDLTDSIKSAEEKGDIAGMSRLTNARNNASEEKNTLESKLKSLLNEEKGDTGALGRYFGLKELGQVFKFAGDVTQAGYTYRQDIANGNIIGASRREGTSIANSIGGAATAVGAGLMATGIGVIPGAIIAGLGMGTNFVSGLIEGSGQAGDAEAQAYMNNFDTKYNALRTFRNIGSNESANAKSANEMYSKIIDASLGTGLDAATISQLAVDAARQGASESRALEMATVSGKWNQATGADVNTMMRLQGMAERYGLGQDVVSTAYGGLQASGMQKAQLNEFLNGLQSVIEDGISNGYLKSADEISAQMTMFATLSGNNPLWTGQNAANNIKQMNAGLSGATSMGNTAQTIAMGSAKRVVDKMSDSEFRLMTGGNYKLDKNGEKIKDENGNYIVEGGFSKSNSYLDYEMALQNPNGKMYGQILKDVQSYSGGNIAAQKEFLSQIFGITSTKTLLELMSMTGGDFSEASYKNVLDVSGVKTEQTSWNDSMLKISDSLNKIGEGKWQDNIDELNKTVQEYLGKAEKQAKQDYRAGLTHTGLSVEEYGLEGAGDEVLKNAKIFDNYNKGGRSLKNQLLKNLMTTERTYTTQGNSRQKPKTIHEGGNDESDKFIKTMAYKYSAANSNGNVNGIDLEKFFTKLNGMGIVNNEAYKSGDLNALKGIITSAFKEVFENITVSVTN